MIVYLASDTLMALNGSISAESGRILQFIEISYFAVAKSSEWFYLAALL